MPRPRFGAIESYASAVRKRARRIFTVLFLRLREPHSFGAGVIARRVVPLAVPRPLQL